MGSIYSNEKASSNPFPRNLVVGKSESEDLLHPTIRSHACRGNGLLKTSYPQPARLGTALTSATPLAGTQIQTVMAQYSRNLPSCQALLLRPSKSPKKAIKKAHALSLPKSSTGSYTRSRDVRQEVEKESKHPTHRLID